MILTHGGEERRAEEDLAIAAALALLDTEHHALVMNVAGYELALFVTRRAGAEEAQEQRAVIEILRARNEALNLAGLSTLAGGCRSFGYGGSHVRRVVSTRTEKTAARRFG